MKHYVVITERDKEEFQKQLNFYAKGGYEIVSAGFTGFTYRYWAIMEKEAEYLEVDHEQGGAIQGGPEGS